MNYYFVAYIVAGLAFYFANYASAEHVMDQYHGRGRTYVFLFLLAVVVPTWPFWFLLRMFQKAMRDL